MPKYRGWHLDISVKGDYYEWPAQYVTPTIYIVKDLIQWRKNAVKDQEYFLACQKECGKEDREFARLFSQEAKRCLRLQRACTLHLPWFSAEPLEYTKPKFWPVDLSSELDEIAYRIILEHQGEKKVFECKPRSR